MNQRRNQQFDEHEPIEEIKNLKCVLTPFQKIIISKLNEIIRKLNAKLFNIKISQSEVKKPKKIIRNSEINYNR